MRPIATEVPEFVRHTSVEADYLSSADGDVCPICQGAGWLRIDVPVGHPSFGRLIKCNCQKEIEARLAVRSMRQISQLMPTDRRTLGTFETENPDQKQALAAATAYARDPNGWMVFAGRVGTGKTHLAAAIANEYQARSGRTVIFAVVPDLLDHLRATFAPSNTVEFDQRFDEVRTCFLLVLDDIGTENATPWAREKLFQIINHRYNENLPTVFTTNQPDAAIDERILSRMLDTSMSRRITLNGDDFRRRGDPTYARGKRTR